MTKTLIATITTLVVSHLACAAPLTAPTAVHTQPDVNAPVITVLSPGTNPEEDVNAAAPSGWTPVISPGPFEGYVLNKDIDKGLSVKLDAPIHMQPKSTAGVLTTMGDEDRASITGLHGKWTQISLDKEITGYIRLSRGSPPPASTISTPVLRDVPVKQITTTDNNSMLSPANRIANESRTLEKTAPAPTYRPTNTGSTVLPRLFQGTFVTTRRPFAPRRPYDWQLNDSSGVRYAYLDISKLLLTDRIENYAGRTVVVFGTPRAMEGSKNIVIQIESIRLK